MTTPKLHLDINASRRDLFQALLSNGLDVTRTPNSDVREDASGEYHLLWATSHQRLLFSFNIKDFVRLAQKHPYNGGIVLASQRSTPVARLIPALNRVLGETKAEEWPGQVRWIQDWRTDPTRRVVMR
jgi:hypothetical protein